MFFFTEYDRIVMIMHLYNLYYIGKKVGACCIFVAMWQTDPVVPKQMQGSSKMYYSPDVETGIQ